MNILVKSTALLISTVVFLSGSVFVVSSVKEEPPITSCEVSARSFEVSDASPVSPVSIPETMEVKTSTEQLEGVLVPSGFTTEELSVGLLGELSKYSHCFIESEKATGINAIFLSSVAALESGWGSSNVAKKYNNLFGWTNTNGDYVYFNSIEDCITEVALKIKEYYLTPEGKYFNGYEVSDINKSYNGRKEWEDEVLFIMECISKRVEKVIK